MKRIPLRTLPDPDQPNVPDAVIEYAAVMRQIIRRPLNQQTGADIEEMRKGIRLLDAIDNCDSDILVLEDNDWEHLAAKTRAMPWAIVDRRVLQFCDDVLNATDTVPAPPNGVVNKDALQVR